MESTSEDFQKPLRTRRPRPTTACIGCRDRRIKCDRAKPTCLECKQHQRLCERPKRGSITNQIVLDPHIEILKTLSQPTLAVQDDAVLRERQNGNGISSQVISMSPFGAFAKGDKETEKNDLWVQEVLVPHNNAESAFLDDETISAIACCIPPPRECDLLFQSFLSNINSLVPVDINHILIQDVVVCRRTPFAVCTPHLLSLILAVLYSGAITSPAVLSFEQMNSIYNVYKKLLKAIDSSAASETASKLQLLQGYLIINTCRASRDDPLSGYEFLPHSIHVAQSLHLNQELEDSVQTEIKRRVWWYLVYLDVESSMASGLPGMIHSDEYTTRMPSLTLDASLWNNEAVSGCSQHTPSMQIAMHGRLLLAQKLQIWMKSMPCEGEIIEFTRSIESLLHLIPDTPATEWPRLYLSLQTDRARCVLQREFSSSTSNCDDSLLRSARSFLEKYIRLATLRSRPNYQWYIPGLLQPLPALMIVLMHLTSCQHLEAESRLSRELIDKIFALRVLRDVGDATMVARAIIRKDEEQKAGSPMYCLLWNLRRCAWERAGWKIPDGEEFPSI